MPHENNNSRCNTSMYPIPSSLNPSPSTSPSASPHLSTRTALVASAASTPSSSPQLSKKVLIRQFFNSRPTLANATKEAAGKSFSGKSVSPEKPQMATAVEPVSPPKAKPVSSQLAPSALPPRPSSTSPIPKRPTTPSPIQKETATTTPLQRLLGKYPLNETFLSRYVITAELGSGGFGHVLSAIRLSDQKPVAVKLILKRRIPVQNWARDTDLGVLPMEVYLVKRCSHPNVVKFEDFYEDERFAYLVMELHGTQWNVEEHPFVQGGEKEKNERDEDKKENEKDGDTNVDEKNRTTEDDTSRSSTSTNHTRQTSHPPRTAPIPPPLMRTHSLPLPLTTLTRKPSMDLFEHIETHAFLSEPDAHAIFTQLASAIHYLHTNNIVHRDLKDENIVIDSNLVIKLIDFGSAAYEPAASGGGNGKNAMFNRFQGTLQYAAPEILAGQRYRGRPADVWAMGVLLYTMLFGECPFGDSEEARVGKYRRPTVGVSRECMDLVDWMLEKKPERRPTSEQVLDCRWVREGLPEKKQEPGDDDRN